MSQDTIAYAVTLPDHSDRIAQDFHLIPSFRTAGVYVDATDTALKNTQSIVDQL